MSTAADREARKTLHGEWRTPIPINFVDDNDRTDRMPDTRYFKGQKRDNVRLAVDKRKKQISEDQFKIERHITLTYYHRGSDGEVCLDQPLYSIEGRANPKYDRIRWTNGCQWVRAGACQRDREEIKKGRNTLIREETQMSAPPDFDELDGIRKLDDMHIPNLSKRFQSAARHSAAAPDWESTVAEVGRVMIAQLEEVERKFALKEAELAAALDSQQQDTDLPAASPPRRFGPEALHSAPPPSSLEVDEDTEALLPPGKVLLPNGEHAMMSCMASCGAMCGSKPKTNDDDEEGDAPLIQQQTIEDLPEARDIKHEGFFGTDELDDIIDRINEVVGIWGVSEAKEREYIKPPVEAMNKLVGKAMSSFMNNPLMNLITFLIDDKMDFSDKCLCIGRYINEHFIQPLCNALVDGLASVFEKGGSVFAWIKDQVKKVVMMMTQMVTDTVVTKSVEALNESDVVD